MGPLNKFEILAIISVVSKIVVIWFVSKVLMNASKCGSFCKFRKNVRASYKKQYENIFYYDLPYIAEEMQRTSWAHE